MVDKEAEYARIRAELDDVGRRIERVNKGLDGIERRLHS